MSLVPPDLGSRKRRQNSFSGRITAHPALQGQPPQLSTWQKPHVLHRANAELVKERTASGGSPLPTSQDEPSKGAALSLFPLGDTSPDSGKDGKC